MHDSDVNTSIDSTLDAIEDSSILDPKPSEPELWHKRRVSYITMFPRSIRKACHAEATANGEAPGRVHPGWYEAARTWSWEADASAYDRQRVQEQALSRAAKVGQVQQDNQAALDYGLEIARRALAKCKDGSQEQRLWLDTLSKLTSERRKELGYDKTIIEQAEPTYNITVPGVNSDNI